MQPRKPNKQERKELFEYYVSTTQYAANEFEDFNESMDTLPFVVFDEYRTEYPGYAGKVLILVPTYDLYPQIVEVYIWHKGKIVRIENEEGTRRIFRENLTKASR